jgi:DNA-binding winged helix-turn-helix (wHTH) protein
MRSIEFLLRLVDQDGVAFVACEDVHGEHAEPIRHWQGRNLISGEASLHPAASCPRCGDGVPYRLGDRYVCNNCRSSVDAHHLQVWTLDRQAFLEALARHLRLRGGVRKIDACLWQLGTGESDITSVECFYHGRGSLSKQTRNKLNAYRRAMVFHSTVALTDMGPTWRRVPLLSLFAADGLLLPTDLTSLLRPRGTVRFDPHSGVVWVGDEWIGEVPLGSKEFYLLECLSEELDHFVSYHDMKREVLRRSGSADEADEATFCHGLKRRIKKHGLAEIDRLLATTNKGDGYRLRACVDYPIEAKAP